MGTLYRQYRDESDARKVLLAEYNDLKYKHQEQKGEEGGGATGETEDPVVLKLKLMWAVSGLIGLAGVWEGWFTHTSIYTHDWHELVENWVRIRAKYEDHQHQWNLKRMA